MAFTIIRTLLKSIIDLKEPIVIGGHEWIYQDLIGRLANADIAASSQHLGLVLNAAGEAEVPDQ